MKPDSEFETLLRNIEGSPDWEDEADALTEVCNTLWDMLTDEQKTAALEKLAPAIKHASQWCDSDDMEVAP